MKNVCDKHGEYEEEVIEILGKQFIQGCPECQKIEDEREARENAERAMKARLKHYEQMGVDPEFIGKTLDDYKPENESERAALQAAKDLDEGKIKKLLLLGDNGTGKTHLADALVQKHNGVRITMFELSARIRAGYNEGLGELEILNRLLTHGIIVIDEVGRTKGSDAERNWISYVTDKAHTHGIRLMFISNRKTARNLPADRRGEAFEYFVDNDVISRLQQDSRIVEVHGRDRRAANAAV